MRAEVLSNLAENFWQKIWRSKYVNVTQQKSLQGILTVLSVLALTSCVSYERDQHIVSGSLTDHNLVAQVTLGATTAEWLLAHVGEPQTINNIGGGEELWTYTSTTRSQTLVRAFPLVAVKLQNQKQVVYQFALKDEVVTRVWQEQL